MNKELTSLWEVFNQLLRWIIPKEGNKEIKDLKVGEEVRIITLNQQGSVVSVDKNKKEQLTNWYNENDFTI